MVEKRVLNAFREELTRVLRKLGNLVDLEHDLRAAGRLEVHYCSDSGKTRKVVRDLLSRSLRISLQPVVEVVDGCGERECCGPNERISLDDILLIFAEIGTDEPDDLFAPSPESILWARDVNGKLTRLE